MEENSHHKDAEEVHHSKEGRTKNLLKNYWAISTIVLAVLLFGMVINLYNNSGIGKTEAGQKVVDFAKLQGYEAKVVSVTEDENLYIVTVEIKGQQQPLYVTKDGKNVAFQVVNLEQAKAAKPADSAKPQPADVPKTDKPKVDLYIFSYCPYGTQNEKGIIPVYNLLKNKADINILAIGAMHGAFEEKESLRQICIEKLYSKDVFMNYLNKFNTDASVGNCRGADDCVNPIINKIFSSLNIDSAKVNDCMKTDAPAIYAAQGAQANSLGIQGSPTLVVNGKQVQARAPAEILKLVCSGFNTQPEECKQTLSTETPSPGFGASSSASASAAECGN